MSSARSLALTCLLTLLCGARCSRSGYQSDDLDAQPDIMRGDFALQADLSDAADSVPRPDITPPTRCDDLGSGIADDPYLLLTAQQWRDLTQRSDLWDRHFKLGADLDLGSQTGDTAPVGNLSSPFTGVLDGDKHVVSGFNNRSGTSYAGLFGYIDDPAAEVKNIAVKDPQIMGDVPSGALVGMLVSGEVSDAASFGPSCYVYSGGYANHKGGLIGEVAADGVVRDVFSTCRVGGTGTGVAGVIGHNEGSLTNAYYANSAYPLTGSNRTGGLIGWNTTTGKVSNTFTVADIIGSASESDVALHIGTFQGMVTNSFFDSTRSVINSGDGGTTVNGTGIDTEAQPSYFFQKKNPPLSSWDFSSTWLERPDDYPILSWLSGS